MVISQFIYSLNPMSRTPLNSQTAHSMKATCVPWLVLCITLIKTHMRILSIIFVQFFSGIFLAAAYVQHDAFGLRIMHKKTNNFYEKD